MGQYLAIGIDHKYVVSQDSAEKVALPRRQNSNGGIRQNFWAFVRFAH